MSADTDMRQSPQSLAMGLKMPTTSSVSVECTRVASTAPIAKTVSMDKAGRIEKRDSPGISGGYAERMSVQTAASFAKILKDTKQNECLILGAIVRPGDGHPLVLDRQLPSRPDAIARTKEHFRYQEGRPAWLGYDIDIGQFPADLKSRVQECGGVLATLQTRIPGFDGAARVARPSSSSGIRNRRTGEETGLRGLHVYVLIKDGADAQRAIGVLHRRLVLAGFGYPFVTKAGLVQVRSIVDTVASGVPYRLWYEADAILSHPDLEHTARGRRIFAREGAALDTTAALPDLSDGELNAFRRAEAELREGVRSEALAIRGRFNVEQGRSVLDVDDDRRWPLVTIAGSHEIHLDQAVAGQRTIRALDIILKPSLFHERTCADPLEPDYGGGVNKAVILSDNAAALRPRIHSQAHGGIEYQIRLTADEAASFVLGQEVQNARA